MLFTTGILFCKKKVHQVNDCHFILKIGFNRKGRQVGTKNAKTIRFVVTIFLISTAFFPGSVMSTVGDISMRLRIFYDATLLFFTIKALKGIKVGCKREDKSR
jgi:hypothetical protein